VIIIEILILQNYISVFLSSVLWQVFLSSAALLNSSSARS
jgi:hypothetical protein